MELIYKYRANLKEFSVEENGYVYYMPHIYILRLQDFFKKVSQDQVDPVYCWYSSLKEIERRIVSRKSIDEERLSSIW